MAGRQPAPALEDLLGAGAIITALDDLRAGSLSPEAAAARACYTALGNVTAAVTECTSGLELAGSGFADDVAIATEINHCDTVPILIDGAFTTTRPRTTHSS